MATGVFISWSGKESRSHKVALLLRDWLPKVIQNVSCFVSSEDIEAGAVWLRNLFLQLEQCSVGIICLTKESIGKPWILFEAGAIAKKFDESRVCPLLIDLAQTDVDYPLAAFNCKKTGKEDIRAVVEMINRSRGDGALAADALDDSFETRWPAFSTALAKLPNQIDRSAPIAELVRPTEAILEELLGLTRLVASQTAGPAVAKGHSGHSHALQLWDHIIATARKKRPLIVGWMEKAQRVVLDEGELVVFFDHTDAHAMDTLANDRNVKFMAEIVQAAGFPYAVEMRLEIRPPLDYE